MEIDKVFSIVTERRGAQYVRTQGMGRVMFRPEADAVVASFGSRIRRSAGDTTFDIVPPIEKAKLKNFGGALVKMALDLDPTPPEPTFDIVFSSDQ